MAKRARPSVDQPTSYFAGQKGHIHFVSSGCTVLDCALGGGFPLGRIANIVGDKSTAKTGLATETIINFLRQYPDGVAAYREVEAAFDKPYAQAMGMPIDSIDFGTGQLNTIEDFAKDLEDFLTKRLKDSLPGVYVLDSLDALSDDAEMEAEFGTSTYGTGKAKAMSAMFRRLVRQIESSSVLLIVISQVRDNIGVTFGDRHKRSGGRALDFYASQVLFLSHTGTLKRSVSKVERPIGIKVKAKVKKNKVGLPLREAEFSFMFGFGIDELEASVLYLNSVHRIDALGVTDAVKFVKEIEASSDDNYHKEVVRLAGIVKQVWSEVEDSFIPVRRKYG